MLNYKKTINYWSGLSDYDLLTAKHLFRTKRYPYCLFFCHLSIEKLLKAIVVKITTEHSPFTHNLIRLAELTKIDFDESIQTLFQHLNEFNVEARYPEWKKNFYKSATKSYTEYYFRETKKLHKWLKKFLCQY